MYTGLHAIASGKQLDVNQLFPKLDGRDVWEQRSRDVIESVLGIVGQLDRHSCYNLHTE